MLYGNVVAIKEVVIEIAGGHPCTVVLRQGVQRGIQLFLNQQMKAESKTIGQLRESS